MILLNNIHVSWLQSIFSKTQKHMPIYTHKKFLEENNSVPPLGVIVNDIRSIDEQAVLKHNIDHTKQVWMSQLDLNLVVPQQEVTQYFIQWQRYRKYWWSSITSTPSLFTINEITHEQITEANIVAQFPWGNQTVETVSTKEENQDCSQLKCSLTLEKAMFILLLDGLNNTNGEMLRLHRNMAPYKISFAVNTEEASCKQDLSRLATLMYYRLKSKDISACLPDFKHSFEQQIEECLQLGVPYTAVLNESTLNDGIFHLLNSNTMLKEEVHIADLESYAELMYKR